MREYVRPLYSLILTKANPSQLETHDPLRQLHRLREIREISTENVCLTPKS